MINTERLPIKLWLNDLEDGALAQAKNLANLPFTFKHVSIMPDSHLGFGMPIGGVLATTDAIIPNAVGVDIACGMCVVKTNLTDISIGILKNIMGKIREEIPVGFNHHKTDQDSEFLNVILECTEIQYPSSVFYTEIKNARRQIGTLGGGNHFIEIQKGDDGYLYIMIHSGSRNVGKKVAEHYNMLAKQLNQQFYSSVPLDYDLAFLPVDSSLGKLYLYDLALCKTFARENRFLMMDRIKKIFKEVIDNCIFDNDLDVHHNYVALEHHFGKNVYVHRKGAISAKTGELGIIPGSQGTKSYIVRGLVNLDSFTSSSHGSGRKIGRNVAKKTLNLVDEIKKLDDQGIIHGIRTKDDLDEATGAYKDINLVMDNQIDLVEKVVELTPIAVIKA